MRVERELEKTIQSLKEELESLKEASNSDKLSLKSLVSICDTIFPPISHSLKSLFIKIKPKRDCVIHV